MSYYSDYTYEYSPAMDNSATTILMIYMLILVVCGIYALVAYIIKGVGLYTIAKRQGEEYPWLAFVPFARTYLQGEVSGDILLKKKSIRNPGIWLIILPIIEGVVIVIFYLLIFVVIGFSAFSSVNYYGPGIGTIVLLTGMMIVFVMGMIVGAGIVQVLKILVNCQIMEKFTTKNMSIVHAVLMGVIPLYEPICFLIMSRKPYNPGMEPPVLEPFMQTPPPMQGAGEQETGFVPQRGLLNPESNAEVKVLQEAQEAQPAEPSAEVEVLQEAKEIQTAEPSAEVEVSQEAQEAQPAESSAEVEVSQEAQEAQPAEPSAEVEVSQETQTTEPTVEVENKTEENV